MKLLVRSALITGCSLLWAVIQTGTAVAAPPANDNFSNAQVISGISGTVNGSNLEATKQAGEPIHARELGGRSVWYKYVAPGTGVMIVDSAPSSIPTVLAVYTGTSVNDLHQIAGNASMISAPGGSAHGRIVFGTQTGLTYYLAIDGKRDAAGNVAAGAVSLSYQLNNSPENDLFSSISNYEVLNIASGYKSLTATNVGASKDLGEPNHAGNPGGKSVWFKFASGGFQHSYSFILDSQSASNPAAGITTLFAIYKGADLGSLTPVDSVVATAGHSARLLINVGANDTFWLAVDGFDAGGGAATGNFMLEYGATKSRREADFDRDQIADIAIFRPTTGTYYSLDSISGNVRAYAWGANGDRPLLNNWDDDERPDYAVFRPDTQIWHLLRSFNSNYTPFSWGLNTDIPLTLNQHVQGVTNCYAAVFRQTTGTWWIRANSGGFAFQFGQIGDIPVTADFDGDGTDEVAVFRPSNGVWYIANPFTGALVRLQQFGAAGDRPVPGDFDGDGKADLAVYRPSNGTWYFLYSNGGIFGAVQFGLSTDIPQFADFSDDGKDDIAVYRPSTGTWYIRRSGFSGYTVAAVQFGQNGDIPVSSPIH